MGQAKSSKHLKQRHFDFILLGYHKNLFAPASWNQRLSSNSQFRLDADRILLGIIAAIDTGEVSIF